MKRILSGIGIMQRVPIGILDKAVYHILSYGEIKRDELQAVIDENVTGGNRKGKVEEHTVKIILGSKKTIEVLKELMDGKIPNTSEIKLLVIALAATAYPVFHEVLTSFSRQFRVQDTATRAFVHQKLSDRYGSNRSTEHGIDAIMPMLIESGLIVRKSVGVFAKGEPSLPVSKEVCEFWIRTDMMVSKNKTIPVDELAFRPWSDFCPDAKRGGDNPVILHVENLLGNKAYLKL